MAIDRYLAMTGAEIAAGNILPEKIGYMACHFSPYTTGLSGCPEALPEGAMLILNDRISPEGHDLRRITAQLAELTEALGCSSVLLDFERPGCRESAELAFLLTDALPCPVGVSALYAGDTTGPVFAPPLPCDVPLPEYLEPWAGREIWLEGALTRQGLLLTNRGAEAAAPLAPDRQIPVHCCEALCCHYQIRCGDDVHFSLWRSPEDLLRLEAQAEGLGIRRMVGLWQELRGIWI